MSIRYITFDYQANIHEVMHLRDQFDKPTEDPVLAERCVIKIEDQLVAVTTDECPIYTVH